MCIVMSKPHKTSELERREAARTLVEKFGITRVDEVYEDGKPCCRARRGVSRVWICCGC